MEESARKTTTVNYWYTVSADGTRGSLAVDHPTGLINLNEYSERFSDSGIVVRYAAITRGFSVSGSQNGRPLSEDALRSYAELCINLINGAASEMVIEWRSHDFLADRRTRERRGNPRFGPSQTQEGIPFVSYMSIIAQEPTMVSTTA